MLNIEKYKNFVINNMNWCQMETDIRKAGGKATIDCAHILCGDCKESFFKWLFEEFKEPILDDVEKEYLSDVIRPFRKKVETISKFQNWNNTQQYIYIALKSQHYCTLPSFPKGTMYKGMETQREYTLEELGL